MHTDPESVKRVKINAQILDKMAVERLSKMESCDDLSFLQVHLWRSTARKMTYPLFLCANFYMSGAVCYVHPVTRQIFRNIVGMNWKY